MKIDLRFVISLAAIFLLSVLGSAAIISQVRRPSTLGEHAATQSSIRIASHSPALVAAEAIHPPSSNSIDAEVQRDLAEAKILQANGDYARAEILLKKLIQFGDVHESSTRQAMKLYADLLTSYGRKDEADRLLKQLESVPAAAPRPKHEKDRHPARAHLS